MNIAVVGYGQMGRMVHEVAVARGHGVGVLIDPSLKADHASRPARMITVTADGMAGIDVAIEFSLAEAVPTNVAAYAAVGVPAVIGTTGWLDRLESVSGLVAGSTAGVVYGSNFSLGAHVFMRTAAFAAGLVADLDEYDLMIHEIHHRLKKDSPSGTALSLARAVMAAAPRKRTIETGRLDRAPRPEELHVGSSRGGSNPGAHTLYLDSDADTIELRHQARSRAGFALGAVRAAEWIVSHTGIHTVDEFIDDLLGHTQP